MRLLQCFWAITLLFLSTAIASAQDRPRVVAVNFALANLAESLVGDAADVVYPVPDDVDPSFWRPSISDISMIQSADLILLNGAGFATWVDRVSLPRSKLVNTSAAIEDQFIVTASITHSHGDGGEHSHEGLASYVWLDPTLAIAQAEAIAGALAGRGLAAPDDVYATLDDLRTELTRLDADAMSALDELADVAMIATHPRFQYFARRYGLSIASLEWEAGAMPNDDDLADLEELIEETGAQVLIWEGQPPEAAIEATAALGLRSATFEPMARAIEGGGYSTGFSDAVRSITDAALAIGSN